MKWLLRIFHRLPPAVYSFLLMFLTFWLFAGISIAIQDKLVISNADTLPWDAPVNSQRTIWSIVWSCLSTIFLCTWTVIHPNIPSRSLLRRGVAFFFQHHCLWMALAIFSPELMTIVAMGEFITVYGRAKKLRHQRWAKSTQAQDLQNKLANITYQFYIQMGGFILETNDGVILCDDGDTSGDIVLDMDQILILAEEGYAGLFATPTIRDIWDRSKFDSVGKILAMTQATWMIVHLISRAAQGLQTSTLELTTAAYVTTTFFTAGFWWKKPLDVRTSTIISAEGISPATIERIIESRNKLQFTTRPHTASSNPPALEPVLIEAPLADADVGISQKFVRVLTRSRTLYHPVSNSFRTKRFPLINAIYTILNQHTSSPWLRFSAIICLALIFGGIHLIALTWHFPTNAELTVWWYASVFATMSPVAIFIHFCGNLLGRPDSRVAGTTAQYTEMASRPVPLSTEARSTLTTYSVQEQSPGSTLKQQSSAEIRTGEIPHPGSEEQIHKPKKWVEILNRIVLWFWVIIYILYRIYLLAEPIAGLRLMPTSVYQAVRWTDALPHVQ